MFLSFYVTLKKGLFFSIFCFGREKQPATFSCRPYLIFPFAAVYDQRAVVDSSIPDRLRLSVFGRPVFHQSLFGSGKKIKECQKKNQHIVTKVKPFWSVVYIMTVAHNPLGINYSTGKYKT